MSGIQLSPTELKGLEQLGDEEPVSDDYVFSTSAPATKDDGSKKEEKKKAPPAKYEPPMQMKFELLTSEANNICQNQEAFEGVRLEFHRHLGSTLTLTHILSGQADKPGTNMEGQAADYALVGQFNAPLSYVVDAVKARGSRLVENTDRPARRAKDRVQSIVRFGTRGDWLSKVIVSKGRHTGRVTGSGRGAKASLQVGYEYTDAKTNVGLSLGSGHGLTASYTQRAYYNSSKDNNTELYMGGELSYLPSQAASALSLATRLVHRHSIFTAFVSDNPSPASRAGLPGIGHFTYARRVERCGTWAARLLLLRDGNTDAFGFRAITAFGFDYHLSQGAVKAYLDSSGRASALAEITLNPLMSLSCSVDGNFPANDYHAGLALQVHL